MNVRIEALTDPAQIEDILAIEEVSFTNPWTREMYLAEFKNRGVSYCYLARNDEGLAVGFCSFWRVLDELHINNLAVSPPFRRSGARSTSARSSSAPTASRKCTGSVVCGAAGSWPSRSSPNACGG